MRTVACNAIHSCLPPQGVGGLNTKAQQKLHIKFTAAGCSFSASATKVLRTGSSRKYHGYMHVTPLASKSMCRNKVPSYNLWCCCCLQAGCIVPLCRSCLWTIMKKSSAQYLLTSCWCMRYDKAGSRCAASWTCQCLISPSHTPMTQPVSYRCFSS